jgi:hypothetical protein
VVKTSIDAAEPEPERIGVAPSGGVAISRRNREPPPARFGLRREERLQSRRLEFDGELADFRALGHNGCLPATHCLPVGENQHRGRRRSPARHQHRTVIHQQPPANFILRLGEAKIRRQGGQELRWAPVNNLAGHNRGGFLRGTWVGLAVEREDRIDEEQHTETESLT